MSLFETVKNIVKTYDDMEVFNEVAQENKHAAKSDINSMYDLELLNAKTLIEA